MREYFFSHDKSFMSYLIIARIIWESELCSLDDSRSQSLYIPSIPSKGSFTWRGPLISMTNRNWWTRSYRALIPLMQIQSGKGSLRSLFPCILLLRINRYSIRCWAISEKLCHFCVLFSFFMGISALVTIIIIIIITNTYKIALFARERKYNNENLERLRKTSK